MTIRNKNGRLHVVSAPGTVGDGRPSRAASALPSRRRPPLVGADGVIAAVVLAHQANAVAVAKGDDDKRRSTGKAVRHARCRLVREVGREAAERIERTITAGRRLPLRSLSSLPESIGEWLVDAAIESCHTVHEFGIDSHAAMVSIAMALRLRAIGQCMLTQGASSGDAEVLGAATKLIGQARLELLAGLEQGRLARESSEKAEQAQRFRGWGAPRQAPAEPAGEPEE